MADRNDSNDGDLKYAQFRRFLQDEHLTDEIKQLRYLILSVLGSRLATVRMAAEEDPKFMLPDDDCNIDRSVMRDGDALARNFYYYYNSDIVLTACQYGARPDVILFLSKNLPGKELRLRKYHSDFDHDCCLENLSIVLSAVESVKLNFPLEERTQEGTTLAVLCGALQSKTLLSLRLAVSNIIEPSPLRALQLYNIASCRDVKQNQIKELTLGYPECIYQQGPTSDDVPDYGMLAAIIHFPHLKKLKLFTFWRNVDGLVPVLCRILAHGTLQKLNVLACSNPKGSWTPLIEMLADNTTLSELSVMDFDIKDAAPRFGTNRGTMLDKVENFAEFTDKYNDQLANVLQHHNMTLHLAFIGFFDPCSPRRWTKSDYFTGLNRCGRDQIRNMDTSLEDFVRLLSLVNMDDEAKTSETRATMLQYGLLREKPELWCLISVTEIDVGGVTTRHNTWHLWDFIIPVLRACTFLDFGEIEVPATENA